jgi:hypothetical protein
MSYTEDKNLKNQKIIGISLSEIMQRVDHSNEKIPIIISHCTIIITRNKENLKIEEIFNYSNVDKKDITNLIDLYNQRNINGIFF